MASLLGRYKNGNYNVKIYSDGTKIRFTKDDEFNAVFPENIDIKITDYCDLGCPFCHENSTTLGKHGDLVLPFIDTLRPYTELAIGGGNPLDHPQLVEFLRYLKQRGIIANLTINQYHFINNNEVVNLLVSEKLIYGLGVSLLNSTDEFLSKVKEYDNTVIHTIAGVTRVSEYERLAEAKVKVLVLGYKHFRRGKEFYNKTVENNIKELKSSIPRLIKSGFNVLSFDNLALEQLDVRGVLPPEMWNLFYMGDDGQHTMYVDLVNRKFARNSTSIKTYDLMDNIIDMFGIVKEN